MRRCIFTAIFLMSLWCSCDSVPNTVTVCKTASCSFPTIAAGVAAAQLAGSEVEVLAGQYDETSRIDITATVTIDFASGTQVAVLLTPPGVWLNVTGGATLNLSGRLQLSGGSIVVGTASALIQSASIEIEYPLLTPAIEAHGTWTQNGPLELSSTSATDNGEALVSLGTVGTWHQGAAATLMSRGGVGVRFSSASTWNQMAECNITASANHLDSVSPLMAAVDMSAGGNWQTSAHVRIEATGLGVYGVYLGNANADWETTVAGTVEIDLVSSAPGVYIDSGSLSQAGPISIAASAAVGVHMAGGSSWQQHAPILLTVSDLGTGVVLREDASWTLNDLAQMTLTGSTGVILESPLVKLTQKAGISINATGASTGIDFSRGGVWSQLSLTTINTTDARATAIVCGSSTACCTQINTLSSARIITSGSTAGLKSDCAAAPSPSPLASVAAAINATATFDANKPTVALSGTVARSSSTAASVGVQLGLNSLTLGDADADLAGLNVTLTVTNSTTTDPTNSNSSVTTSTFAYRTIIDNATSLVQSYTFFPQSAPVSFAGIDFTVRAGTVKWSLNLTTATPPGGAGRVADAQSNGFTARYRLSDLTSAAAATSSADQVLRRSDTPQAGMTTFIVVLPPATSGSRVRGVVQVEAVNVALIDDAVVPLVSVDLAFTNGSYALELRFPPFNQSVVYDPSVGLGALLGRSTNDDGGSSSSNTGLIIGVAVAVPLAVAVVLVVIGAAVGVAWRRKRTLQTRSAIEFGEDAADDPL